MTAGFRDMFDNLSVKFYEPSLQHLRDCENQAYTCVARFFLIIQPTARINIVLPEGRVLYKDTMEVSSRYRNRRVPCHQAVRKTSQYSTVAAAVDCRL
jgi:hypothetical protein